MGQYKVMYAASTEEMEDKMNDLAQEGWSLVSLSFVPNSALQREIVVAMEKRPAEDRTRYKDSSRAYGLGAYTRASVEM